jgi:hypothetical protein
MAGFSTPETTGDAAAWQTSIRKCLYERALPDIIWIRMTITKMLDAR